MASPATTEAYLDPADYPAAWVWDEDGEQLAGTFVGFTEGYTRNFGKKVIAVLEVEGVKRSVWLTTTVLYGKFRDELRSRPGHKLQPGERVNISRNGKAESEEAMGAYWKFSVGFPDRPEPSTEDLFDLGDEPAATEPKEADDDGVPF
jgi:hypothetical protein